MWVSVVSHHSRALGYNSLLRNNTLLSSLWDLSCHIPYGVKVTIIITTAALGGQQNRGEFHTCHVSLTHPARSGLNLLQVGREEKRCVWTIQTLGPQILWGWILSYNCLPWLMGSAWFYGTSISALRSHLHSERSENLVHQSKRYGRCFQRETKSDHFFQPQRKWLTSPFTH